MKLDFITWTVICWWVWTSFKTIILGPFHLHNRQSHYNDGIEFNLPCSSHHPPYYYFLINLWIKTSSRPCDVWPDALERMSHTFVLFHCYSLSGWLPNVNFHSSMSPLLSLSPTKHVKYYLFYSKQQQSNPDVYTPKCMELKKNSMIY